LKFVGRLLEDIVNPNLKILKSLSDELSRLDTEIMGSLKDRNNWKLPALKYWRSTAWMNLLEKYYEIYRKPEIVG